MSGEGTPHLHFDLEDRVRQVTGIASVELDEEIVLYDRDTDQVHRLDAVASTVWSQLDGTESLGRICDRLADVFDQPVDRIRSDVVTLVSNLSDLGLVERSGKSGGR